MLEKRTGYSSSTLARGKDVLQTKTYDVLYVMEGPEVAGVFSGTSEPRRVDRACSKSNHWSCVVVIARQSGSFWNYKYIEKLASRRAGEHPVDTIQLLRLRLVPSPHFLLRTSACLLVRCASPCFPPVEVFTSSILVAPKTLSRVQPATYGRCPPPRL